MKGGQVDLFKFEIDPKAWEEVVSQLNDLTPEIGQKVFRKVLKAENERMAALVKVMIRQRIKNPEESTGRLVESVFVRTVRSYEPRVFKSAVTMKIGNKRGEGAYYWYMVEGGHRIVVRRRSQETKSVLGYVVKKSLFDTGRETRPMRFAYDAFRSISPEVPERIGAGVNAEIERIFRRKRKGRS